MNFCDLTITVLMIIFTMWWVLLVPKEYDFPLYKFGEIRFSCVSNNQYPLKNIINSEGHKYLD